MNKSISISSIESHPLAAKQTTFSRESQLAASYSSIWWSPPVTTDSAPHTTVTELQTTFCSIHTSNQPDVAIMTT